MSQAAEQLPDAEVVEDTLESIADVFPGESDDDEQAQEAAPAEEGEEEEEESPDDEAEEAEEEGEEDPEIEWTTNSGKTYKVKQSELRDGYMRQDDYQRKTADLAERRRIVESTEQQIVQERQQAANQLDVLIQGLYKQLVGDQEGLGKLIDEDPQEYLRQQAAMNQRAAQLQQAIQERQALQGRQTQAEQQKQREWRKQEAEKLIEKLPHWKDEKKATEEQTEIAEYLSQLGYTSAELGELVDHRALLVARDAAKYRRLQAAKAKKATEVTRKPVRPGAAGTGAPNDKAKRTAERLRSNPDSLDALGDFMGSAGL